MTPGADDLRGLSYAQIVQRAVAWVATNGYTDESAIDWWAEQMAQAARREFRDDVETEANVRRSAEAILRRATTPHAISRVPGVTSFTIQQIQPKLRAELDRRVAASVGLIRLNRPQAIAKAQQRFRGWATSIPPGGDPRAERKNVTRELRKPLAQLPFHERRVVIDQNAKLFSAINSTIAEAGGAIGAIWHSHKDQAGYDGRPDHNARDGKFFLIRESWARDGGLVKPGPNGYTDDIEQPAELPYCKCSWQFVFSLRNVPDACMTAKGRAALTDARKALSNAGA